MNSYRNFRGGEIYHLFNKSIANYGIFQDDANKDRFLKALSYYNEKTMISLSVYLRKKPDFTVNLFQPRINQFVKFISYCIMPDHYHLLIKVMCDKTVSKYINDVENSYTRYFNVRFDRKGPLWQSNFKYRKIRSNEQLLHASRYIHLNPTTSNLVNKPEEWRHSSYSEFLNNPKVLKEIVTEISINNSHNYKKFVEDQKDYQIELKRIKKLLLD